MTISPAIQSILDTYDAEDLETIAEHGCQTGCAREHIYYSETSAFYDEHESDINDYLSDTFGDDFMFKCCTDCHDMTDMKNKLVWTFIELVAYNYAESLEVA